MSRAFTYTSKSGEKFPISGQRFFVLMIGILAYYVFAMYSVGSMIEHYTGIPLLLGLLLLIVLLAEVTTTQRGSDVEKKHSVFPSMIRTVIMRSIFLITIVYFGYVLQDYVTAGILISFPIASFVFHRYFKFTHSKKEVV